MLENGLTHILSTDRHFDRLAEVERIDPHDFRRSTQSVAGNAYNPRCLNEHCYPADEFRDCLRQPERERVSGG